MATGPGFAGPFNVYTPNWAASGRLAVAYSRNVKSFPWLKAIQMIESPKPQGYYLKISPQEAARVVQLQDYAWIFGSERPMHPEGMEQFQYVSFQVNRRDYGFALDEDTEKTAEWDIAEEHAKIHAAKAMTARTIEIITALTTVANWQTAADIDLSSNHTSTATALTGGQLDQGTSTNPYIKKFIDRAQVLIDLDTLGTVKPDQLHMIMNPHTAYLLAESAEIHDYLKGSPDAMHEIRTGSSPNARYGPGLPSAIYGMDVIVDNTVRGTTRKNSAGTMTKAYAFPDQQIAIVARPGELEGVYGTPSWSTIVWFWYRDEMTLERFQDSRNRRMDYHLVDAGIPQIVSPLSGYLLTAATSVAS